MTLNPNAVPSTPGVSHYMPPPELQRVSISAGGGITIDGLISYPGPLQFAAGNVFTEGATGSIFNRSVFGGTSVSAQSGDAIIDGIMAAEGGLTMTAGADIIVQGSVASLGSTLAAGGSVSIPGTLTSSFGQTTIQAGSFIDVGGVLGAGATQLTSGANVSIGGALTAQGALGIDADGGISIPGTVGDTGSTFVAGGAVSIGGILTSGATTLRGDGIDIGGAILAAATQLTSAAGVTIEGSVSARGTLGISAADGIDEHLGGSISAGAISLIAKTANDVIDGALTASGALNLTAGADISQGAASAIDAATTADLLAPGTITLAGLLAAPGILIGERATRDVVWNGNTLRADTSLHGPTKAINVLAPLAPGAGVFVQSAAFQQIGNAFVDPLTGTSATLQITIEGKGTAHFDQLTAPQAQLLLVLDNAGFANGLIDVAGLNAYYTQGETPVQAANLFGVVGGHHGTAAAGVGFSHLNSNINYQINGCPIQSIDCVLISPVVVPVVDPVTDYAEGTQRRRHQDDDALPNVGEEDY
jgi:filamentous hemagglutinin